MEKLILPDGTAIGSGIWGEMAICQVLWTQSRNLGPEMTLGCAAPAELEVEIFSPQKPDIPHGTRLIYEENGVTRGIFYCQSLERLSKSRWVLKAQDAMHKFARELPGTWGGKLLPLLQTLCDHCGVTCGITGIPGATVPVPEMLGITGTELLTMLGQAAGRYFYIDEQEVLRAGWYTTRQTIDNFNHLTVAEYTTLPIERVWLRRNRNDVGSVYPEGEGNTLIIEGNPLFSGDCRAIAQRLWSQLKGFGHTPFTCKLLPGQEVPPGCLVDFTDLDGVARTGLVMFWEKKNGICTIRGVGSHSLQDAQAFNHITLTDLNRQMLTIDRSAQGLQVSHSDLRGNVDTLELSLSGLSNRVTQAEEGLTSQLTQTADGLRLSVSQLQGALEDKTDREELSQVTEHFLFDAGGMTIHNSASGMGIQVSENQVVFTGGDDPSTVVRPDTMETARLTVGKRLDMGAFSFLPRTTGNLSFRFTGN